MKILAVFHYEFFYSNLNGAKALQLSLAKLVYSFLILLFPLNE